MSKKHCCRFSLRMNPSDAVQAKAAHILNTKGHCISEFVARAVVAYLSDNPLETPYYLENSDTEITEKSTLVQSNADARASCHAEKAAPKCALDMLSGLGDLCPEKYPK